MKIANMVRQFMATGSVLIIALIILMAGLSLSCLNKQTELATAVKTTNHQLVRLHAINLTLYQMDIGRIRYRRSGLNLFRLAYEESSDSLTAQINDLRLLTKDDSTQAPCIESVAKGVADLKLFWQSTSGDADATYNKLRNALQEDTKIDDIQSDLTVIDQNLQNHLTAIRQSNQKTLTQTRTGIIASVGAAVLIVIVLMITFGKVQTAARLS